MVKAPASRAANPGSDPPLAPGFFWVESYQRLKSWHSSATLPRAWRYRVNAGTGWPGVSILWLGEVVWFATSISMWQHAKLCELIPPWDTLACYCDVKPASKQPTNKQTAALRSVAAPRALESCATPVETARGTGLLGVWVKLSAGRRSGLGWGEVGEEWDKEGGKGCRDGQWSLPRSPNAQVWPDRVTKSFSLFRAGTGVFIDLAGYVTLTCWK